MKKVIEIEGMHCNHCKMRVEKALKAIKGVDSVIVNLETKTAEIEYSSEIDEEEIVLAIDEAGFKYIG